MEGSVHEQKLCSQAAVWFIRAFATRDEFICVGLEGARSSLHSVAMYEIVEKIAESGMALIYKAQHTETGELAAIKVMSPEIASSDIFLKRFEQEYDDREPARSSRHRPQPRLWPLRIGPFLVMEYIEGESLGDRSDARWPAQ